MTVFFDWREWTRPRQDWFPVHGGSLNDTTIDDRGPVFYRDVSLGPSVELDGEVAHFDRYTEVYVKRAICKVMPHPCIRGDAYPSPRWVAEDFDMNGPYVTWRSDQYILQECR